MLSIFCNFTTYRHYFLCINEKIANFINIQTIRKHWNLTSKIFVKTSTFRIQKSDHYISNKYEIYLRNDLRTKLVPFKISITTFTRYLFKQFFSLMHIIINCCNILNIICKKNIYHLTLFLKCVYNFKDQELNNHVFLNA